MTTTEGRVLYHNTQRWLAETIVIEGFAAGVVYLTTQPVEVCDSRTWVRIELDSLTGLRREHGDCELYHTTVYCVRARALNRRARRMTIVGQADLDAEAADWREEEA